MEARVAGAPMSGGRRPLVGASKSNEPLSPISLSVSCRKRIPMSTELPSNGERDRLARKRIYNLFQSAPEADHRGTRVMNASTLR